MRRFLCLALLSVLSIPCWAGFTEIGATANYRRSTIDTKNYEEEISYTASVSYYFWQMSAMELSYTSGYSMVSVKSTDPTDPGTTDETNFSLTGLDFVVTLAQRTDPLVPYVKIGGGYMVKQIFRQVGNDAKELIATQKGLVPSAGIGFKIGLSKWVSLRFGVDAWTSPLSESPLTVDYAGRAGLSWMF